MFAFLARSLGITLLALAVVLAVLDLTRSVAGSRIIVTSLDTTWTATSPGTRTSAQSSVEGVLGDVGGSVLTGVLALPGWLLVLTLALLLLWIGRRRRSAYSRFARE